MVWTNTHSHFNGRLDAPHSIASVKISRRCKALSQRVVKLSVTSQIRDCFTSDAVQVASIGRRTAIALPERVLLPLNGITFEWQQGSGFKGE